MKSRQVKLKNLIKAGSEISGVMTTTKPLISNSDLFTSVNKQALMNLKDAVKQLMLEKQNKQELASKIESLDRVLLNDVLADILGKSGNNPLNFISGGEKIWLHLNCVNEVQQFFLEFEKRVNEIAEGKPKNVYLVGLYENDWQRIDLYFSGWNPETVFSDFLENKNNHKVSDNFKMIQFYSKVYRGKMLLELKIPVCGKQKGFLRCQLDSQSFALPADWIKDVRFVSQPELGQNYHTFAPQGFKQADQFPLEGKIGVRVEVPQVFSGWVLVDDVSGKFFHEIEIHHAPQVKEVEGESIVFFTSLALAQRLVS